MKALFARGILVALVIAVALVFLGVLFPQFLPAPQQALNWAWDTSGPEIGVDLPSGYIHGSLPLRIALRDESAAEVRHILVDGQVLPGSPDAALDTTKLADGVHTLTVEAVDRSLRGNTATGSFSFKTHNTPPKLTTKLDPGQVGQGKTLAIRLSVSEPVTLTGSLDGKSLPFVPAPSTKTDYYAVLGFDPDSKVGPRNLEVSAVDEAGLETKVQVPVTVTKVDYPTESLSIPEDRSDLLSPSISDAEIDYLDKIFSLSSPEQLWSGPFQIPARAVTSSPFAIRRSYNGGPFGSYHGGMDIAAFEGTSALAANRGRVVLAEPLKVRGNAVILDHGLGVYSAYYHLSAFKVQKGQMVEKGQTVGLVGNTGLSTGAHLHWEMRVTGNPVDPLEWTTRTIP